MTEKLILIAFLCGGVLLYGLLDPRQNGRHDTRTWLDRLIPFMSVFSYPYLGLYVFVPTVLLSVILTPLALPYLAALDIGMYSGVLAWLFFPTKMHHPHVRGRTFSERLVLLVYKGDPHANGFPSAHVFSSVISAYYLSIVFPAYAWIAWIAGATIALSTMFIKRHHALDAAAGILWAVASILLAKYFFPL